MLEFGELQLVHVFMKLGQANWKMNPFTSIFCGLYTVHGAWFDMEGSEA